MPTPSSIDLSTCPSIPALFAAQVQAGGDRTFLLEKQNGQWIHWSWRQIGDRVQRLAAALHRLGITPGDRVVIVSENRPEWVIADLAIMQIGAISVPAYITNKAADHLHILNNTDARLVIVSTAALAVTVLQACLDATHTPQVIAMQPPAQTQAGAIGLHWWADLLDQDHHGAAPFPVIGRKDTATIIHTSGTGGAPKGVMLSHGALLSNCLGAQDLLAPIAQPDERFLSFLPLSHAYEHTVGLIFPIALGAQIAYAEGIDSLAANMAETHPTIMTAVPRLYETMRARILAAIQRQGGLKARLFLQAVALGTRRCQGQTLSWRDRLTDRVLDLLVRRKVKARFGGRLKALVSGGAPLSYEVGIFFQALGIRILQGYGMTECGPVISCNTPFDAKVETVGPPVKGIQLKIAADGEILARGQSLMQGYWNDRQASRAMIVDGWLHTGDVGALGPDGHLRITDRKKDIIVNSGGDNVAPQRVEGFLTLCPEIAQAMVHGDRRPHLVALIVPDEQWARDWAKHHDKPQSLADLIDDGAFVRAMGLAVDRVNAHLSPIEKIRRFLLSDQAFSTDNGLMTPTLKIRRPAIGALWGEKLEQLYAKH